MRGELAFSRLAASGSHERVERPKPRATSGNSLLAGQGCSHRVRRYPTAATAEQDIKRNAVTDTIGLLLGIDFVQANVQDFDCAADLIRKVRRRLPFITYLFADGGYSGSRVQAALADQRVEIVKRTDKQNGLKVFRRRLRHRSSLHLAET